MYVHETGQEGAPSIVFFHGGSMSGDTWLKHAARLREYHCIMPDLPGHGKSSDMKWDSLAKTVDLSASLIKEKATNGRAHIVGLSMGGYVVATLLSKYPEIVDRAMISSINTIPFPPFSFREERTIIAMTFIRLAAFIFPKLLFKEMPEEEFKATIKGIREMDFVAYRKMLHEAVKFRVPPISSDSKSKVLAVAGGKDNRMAVKSLLDMEQKIPGVVTRVVPNGGHVWSDEDPELFSQMVRNWIEEKPLPEEMIETEKYISKK